MKFSNKTSKRFAAIENFRSEIKNIAQSKNLQNLNANENSNAIFAIEMRDFANELSEYTSQNIPFIDI